MFKVKRTFMSQKSQSTSQSSNTSESIPLGQRQVVQVPILRKSINLRRILKHLIFLRLLWTMTKTYLLSRVKNQRYLSMNWGPNGMSDDGTCSYQTKVKLIFYRCFECLSCSFMSQRSQMRYTISQSQGMSSSKRVPKSYFESLLHKTEVNFECDFYLLSKFK